MKNLFKLAILIFAGAMVFGCSSDSEEAVDASKLSPQLRTVGSVYPEFSSLFATLYGTNYDVSNSTSYVTQDGGTRYGYNTVTRVENGVTVTKGFLIEVPGNVLYYEYNAVAKTAREYDWNGSQYISSLYNLESDAYYNSNGFSPSNTPNSQGRRWFGWEYAQGPCGEAGVGEAYLYHDYYVFGIRIHHIRQVWVNDPTRFIVEPC